MDDTSVMDGLPKLMESLKIAVDRKSTHVSGCLDSILTKLQTSENESLGESITDELTQLLQWDSPQIVAKAACTVAELSKTDSGREKCAVQFLIKLLVTLLRSDNRDLDLTTQCCRALGNICYENDKGRKLVLEEGCLEPLLATLNRSVNVANQTGKPLRSAAAGFLLNLLAGQESVQQQAMSLGVVDSLTRLLEADMDGEDTTTHVLLILGLLADSGPAPVLDARLAKMTVAVLGSTTSPDTSEMCLELLYGQAEHESVKEHLARAGLCELLVHLLEKHKPLVDDDETRNLMKMACDLIVLVLTGDLSMDVLYAEGKGEVFNSMVAWLSSGDEDLQITGVLAMGNFARTDKHCVQMVQAGVGNKLLVLLAKGNSPDGDIRLQHALLSALRNLVIPSENKASLLADGLVDTVYPMLAVPTFPVVFKLLGTLRMLVDNQEGVARELGRRAELVTRLVAWCESDDHPGVQGEANRLLAWLVNNSRDEGVANTMLEGGAVPRLVHMVEAEHAVMQTEALLALSRLAPVPLCGAALVECELGSSLVKLVERDPLTNTVGLALLGLLDSLLHSDSLRDHLVKAGLVAGLDRLCTPDRAPELRTLAESILHRLSSP